MVELKEVRAKIPAEHWNIVMVVLIFMVNTAFLGLFQMKEAEQVINLKVLLLLHSRFGCFIDVLNKHMKCKSICAFSFSTFTLCLTIKVR